MKIFGFVKNENNHNSKNIINIRTNPPSHYTNIFTSKPTLPTKNATTSNLNMQPLLLIPTFTIQTRY